MLLLGLIVQARGLGSKLSNFYALKSNLPAHVTSLSDEHLKLILKAFPNIGGSIATEFTLSILARFCFPEGGWLGCSILLWPSPSIGVYSPSI